MISSMRLRLNRALSAVAAVLSLVAAVSAGALPAAGTPAVGGRRVPSAWLHATRYPRSVVIYVDNLDWIHQRWPDVRATVHLGRVQRGRSVSVDLTDPAQQPAIIVSLPSGERWSRAVLTLRDGAEVLAGKAFVLGRAVRSGHWLPPGREDAATEPGSRGEKPPRIALPKVSDIRNVALTAAPRRMNLASAAFPVVSGEQFPMISAVNNLAITRQTEHPDDPEKRSAYIPLHLFLPPTDAGRGAVRTVNFLAEVPLDPRWADARRGARISLPAALLRLHFSDEMVKRGNREVNVLGEGLGGLGQLVGSKAVDADGNIYYSGGANGVIRFNVHTDRYEYPPISALEVLRSKLPTREDLPGRLQQRQTEVRWNPYVMIAVGGSRLYLVPVQSAARVNLKAQRLGLACSGVVSIPLNHWDDPEAFAREVKLLAVSWPGAGPSLYADYPALNDEGRKIGRVFFADGALYLESYPGAHGGPWKLTPSEDGTDASLEETPESELKRASAAHAEGLPTNGLGLLQWRDYGELQFTPAGLRRLLGESLEPGGDTDTTTTVFYDVLSSLMTDPVRYAALRLGEALPSSGPSYMVAAIPWDSRHVLGLGEYGYFLERFDAAPRDEGQIRKSYVLRDDAGSGMNLPLALGLGPYTHLWWRSGGKWSLLLGGYIGLGRLELSSDGPASSTAHIVKLTMREERLDEAGSGEVERYRWLTPGIDGRVFLTGTHTAARGGTAFSGGLLSFKPDQPAVLEKLSFMSRGYWTTMLRSRVETEMDGTQRQLLSLAAPRIDQSYLFKLDKGLVPRDTEPKVFLYECETGKPPRALYGFSLPLVSHGAALIDQAFSRDRQYLVILQQGRLLTFDLAEARFVDGVDLARSSGGEPPQLVRFSRPDSTLIETPDDRLLLLARGPDPDHEATFYQVDVSPEGMIGLEPFVTLQSSAQDDLKRLGGAVITFVPDLEHRDGSYDLFIGSYWRSPTSTVHVIEDFLPPRSGLENTGEPRRPLRGAS
jgi:hypothetical protein